MPHIYSEDEQHKISMLLIIPKSFSWVYDGISFVRSITFEFEELSWNHDSDPPSGKLLTKFA
jgi:hypothetical protein